MSRLLLSTAFVLTFFIVSVADAAVLNYSPRTVATSRTIEYMDIAATEGGDTIWEMSIVLSVSDGHTYWMPGDIVKFVDTQYGGGFDYGSDSVHAAPRGIFVTGHQDQLKLLTPAVLTQDPDKFVMTLSGVSGGFDTVQTITINAPNVSGAGYTSTVNIDTTATNNSGGTLSNAGYSATNAQGLNLVGDGNDYTFDNPLNGKIKGDPHTINHPYYDLVSWFGGDGTTGPVEDGLLAQATVSAGAPATMRPGLQFKMESNQDLTYSDLANSLRGAVAQSGPYGGVVRLELGSLREPTGRDGIGRNIADGQSFTIAAVGTIMAPIPEPASFGLIALGGMLMLRRC